MKVLVMILGLMILNSLAQAFEGKWPPTEMQCPQSQDHFAIVGEQVSGTNNSLYCKLITGESYKYQNDPYINAADYINCATAPLEINSIVLVTRSYHEVLDKLGNKRCLGTIVLIKVIGKITY